MGELLGRVFRSPLMMVIACIEFTSGVLRNGIMQWYFVFAKEVPAMNDIFFTRNWGISIAVSGMIGGFAAGFLSDKIFQSRRAPPAVLMNVIMVVLLTTMLVLLYRSPTIVGFCAVMMCFAVIGVHSLMSGTAAADFGGRKATATASGIVDGFVYLGSGMQSFAVGYLVKDNDWTYWPLFLLPFAVIGFLLSLKIYWELPEATKKYLVEVENKVIKVRPQRKLWVIFPRIYK
jgi:OPA family glycerol-3-phosphate transporter-like MFS transporter